MTININRESKTYLEYRYDEMKALIDKKLGEAAKMPQENKQGSEVEFRMTDSVTDIAGCRSHRVVKLDHGKPESDVWVCSDLMPAKLRPVNEKMRAIFTTDFWRRSGGNPGLVEILFLYGIPLRVSVDGKNVLEGKVGDGVRPASSFQVPSGYQRVEQ